MLKLQRIMVSYHEGLRASPEPNAERFRNEKEPTPRCKRLQTISSMKQAISARL